MIPLASRNLSAPTQAILDERQALIDAEPTFDAQKNAATRLWKGKSRTEARKLAFQEVRTVLADMCPVKGICPYCEHNEDSDIEHIIPKSFYPEATFVWENYLLACKLCNMTYKWDHCYVLDHLGAVLKIPKGALPPNSDTAFINPRTESPNDLLLLNLKTFQFVIPRNLSISEYNKALTTIEILGLNEREPLIRARESAHSFFYDTLDRLLRILESNSIEELRENLRPNAGRTSPNKPLDDHKAYFRDSFRNAIQSHQHPAVWHAIKLTGRKVDRKWHRLFEGLPEALTW